MLDKNVLLDGKTILITGSAGFIGANLVSKVLKTYNNALVIGLDSVNDYYDVSIKEFRLKKLEIDAKNSKSKYEFIKGNIADKGTDRGDKEISVG